MPTKLPEKKSPLKEAPPRQAGQSLHEFMEEQFSVEVFSAIASVLAFGIAAAVFWIAYLFKTPLLTMACIFSVITIVAFFLATLHIRKQRKEYRKLKQGRDGERIVGDFLEDLRQHGYKVFHDIPNAKKATFNIDHVLIGPAGVFTIETKTFSKLAAGDKKIRYKNDQLTIPGLGQDYADDALNQAKAAANFVRQKLTEATGHKIKVQPLLIFPGWWVEEPSVTERSNLLVWIINEKRVFDWITKSTQRLSRENIHLYANRIKLHITDCDE